MSKTLIEQIEEAVTKDDFEPLAAQLNVEINKRQGVETIRAELLEAAEGLAEKGVTTSSELDPDAGDPDASNEPAPEKPKYQGRMLKHIKNGRTFPWTAALAKSRHMKEV
ncbi:hypothetical protein J7J47_11885 [Halomonas sp. ISL-60]|uniref:hypothetical protein n=1 Tax=Halomonas sp. ISL-56 TaxID=2819149 RepID=UPI001BECD8D2|nr:hypothetical protein [Halomonas sp. ISL-56]MBT2772923.1 hypothetical protein [Halomonas sp. ISL-60]MBT2799970.1 hypothetical protein [Halomonas sp. ISL-56]